MHEEPKYLESRAEVFETRREFNNRFPSKLFLCSKCKTMTAGPFICKECGHQANGIFKDINDTYKYIIKEESEELIEIFKPIELQQQEGESHGN